MKTTNKPANQFHLPVPAIISCMGPLLAVGPLASCGTGPSAVSTSQPVALLSEYGLRSWRDSPAHIHEGAGAGRSLQFSEGTWAIKDHPLAWHDSIRPEGMENGDLAADAMSTNKPDDSRRGSDYTMDLYGEVARATRLTSSILLEPDETINRSESGMIANGYWRDQASR